MKKRVVAMFLSIAMLFSMVTVNAFADDGFTVKGSTSAAKLEVGETVDFTVEVTKNLGVIVGQIDISWEPDTFELVGIEFPNDAFGQGDSKELKYLTEEDRKCGQYSYTFGSDTLAENITNIGTVLKLTLKILDTASAKNYPVSLKFKEASLINSDLAEVNGTAVNGSITLTSPVTPVESVTLDKTALTLAVDGSAILKATVNPDNATDKTVTWTTSNAKIATVDNNGKVTAVGVGTATITATAGDKTAECAVTVKSCLHTNKTHVEAEAATCLKAGMNEHWTCDNCGALFAKENDTEPTTEAALVIPKEKHTFTSHPAKAATCTEKGNIAYKYCSGCGMNYDDKDEVINGSVELPALGHLWPDSSAGWETNESEHWKTCQRSGCDAKLDKAEHDKDHEANCRAEARCKVCNYVMEGVNPNNHIGQQVWRKTWDTHRQVWDCCQAPVGEAEQHNWKDGVCTVCEYPCEHPTTETVNAVEPSHKDGTPGYTGDTVCTVCRVTLKTGTTIPADQHVWEWVNSDETQHWQRCTVKDCDRTQNTANHEYKEVVDAKYQKSAATCTAKAVYYKSCVCGKVSTETFETGETIPHGPMIYTGMIPATCTSIGTKEYWECNTCKALFSDAEGKNKVQPAELTIPALGHDWAKDWTTDGTNHWHKCTRCDAIDGSAAHTSDKAENKANCQHKAKCDVCGVTYGELGAHDLKLVAEKPSTCKVNGTGAYYKCEVCGKLFSDADGKTEITAPTVLPLAEHTWDKVWHANKDGHYYECTVCGTAGTVTAHTPGAEATETTAQTCTECGYIITPATNHGDNHVKDESKWVSDATSHWHACSGCSQQLDKANHTVTDWTVDKEATTSAEGLRHGNCSVCGHVVYETIAKINNGGHGNGGHGNGGSKNDNTKKDDGKKVESGRTFDAGIALYVGLSVLSVTGGALVIGKKKERF